MNLVQNVIMGADYVIKTIEREDYEDVEDDKSYENNEVLLDDKSISIESTEQTIPKTLPIGEGILDATHVQYAKNQSHEQSLPAPRTSMEDAQDINQLKSLVDHENHKPRDIVTSCVPETMSFGSVENSNHNNAEVIETSHNFSLLKNDESNLKSTQQTIINDNNDKQNAKLAHLDSIEHNTAQPNHQHFNALDASPPTFALKAEENRDTPSRLRVTFKDTEDQSANSQIPIFENETEKSSAMNASFIEPDSTDETNIGKTFIISHSQNFFLHTFMLQLNYQHTIK